MGRCNSQSRSQVDDEHGFIRFFKSLPDVGGDNIRIFDRGDWYTAHGEDANFIARTVSFGSILLGRTVLTDVAGLQDHLGGEAAWTKRPYRPPLRHHDHHRLPTIPPRGTLQAGQAR